MLVVRTPIVPLPLGLHEWNTDGRQRPWHCVSGAQYMGLHNSFIQFIRIPFKDEYNFCVMHINQEVHWNIYSKLIHYVLWNCNCVASLSVLYVCSEKNVMHRVEHKLCWTNGVSYRLLAVQLPITNTKETDGIIFKQCRDITRKAMITKLLRLFKACFNTLFMIWKTFSRIRHYKKSLTKPLGTCKSSILATA